MEIFINVVGTYYHPDTVPVGSNDFIILRPEPQNKYDPDAIAVVNTTNEHIGYVSNSIKTAAQGCSRASELKHIVTGICTAQVLFGKDNVIIAKLNL